MQYLVDNHFCTKVYEGNSICDYISIFSYLNQTAKSFFIDFILYRKLAKQKFEFKNNIPIFFSRKLLLFYLKDCSGNRYLINYYELIGCASYEDKIIFTFQNGDTLEAEFSKKIVKKEIDKCRMVIKYFDAL